MRTLIASLLLSAILGTGATAGAEVVSGIAATVNDEIITIYELNNEYAKVLKEEEKKGDEKK